MDYLLLTGTAVAEYRCHNILQQCTPDMAGSGCHAEAGGGRWGRISSLFFFSKSSFANSSIPGVDCDTAFTESAFSMFRNPAGDEKSTL